MSKFRKKSVIVEAEAFYPGTDYGDHGGVYKDDYGYYVVTESGDRVPVGVGDYVIKHLDAHTFSTMSAVIFIRTYEAVE